MDAQDPVGRIFKADNHRPVADLRRLGDRTAFLVSAIVRELPVALDRQAHHFRGDAGDLIGFPHPAGVIGDADLRASLGRDVDEETGIDFCNQRRTASVGQDVMDAQYPVGRVFKADNHRAVADLRRLLSIVASDL